jgi:hypothetical protein
VHEKLETGQLCWAGRLQEGGRVLMTWPELSRGWAGGDRKPERPSARCNISCELTEKATQETSGNLCSFITLAYMCGTRASHHNLELWKVGYVNGGSMLNMLI